MLAFQTVRYVADTLSVWLPVRATCRRSTMDRPERCGDTRGAGKPVPRLALDTQQIGGGELRVQNGAVPQAAGPQVAFERGKCLQRLAGRVADQRRLRLCGGAGLTGGRRQTPGRHEWQAAAH